MTQEEKIRAHVDACIDRYKSQCGISFGWRVVKPDERQHVVDIGTSVLCTKWGVGYPGGSFVQAIIDNDLHQAFSRADYINQDCIKFYLMLLYNSEYIA